MNRKPRRSYKTVQAWMEATGTTGETLARLTGIDRSHLSKILTGSRRCSLEKALALSKVTNVPVENLMKWLISDRGAQSRTAA